MLPTLLPVGLTKIKVNMERQPLGVVAGKYHAYNRAGIFLTH
jgi:hypothetical protein